MIGHSNNNNSNDQNQNQYQCYGQTSKPLNKPLNIGKTEVHNEQRVRKRNKTRLKKENKEIKKSLSCSTNNHNHLTEIPTNKQIVTSFRCIESGNDENSNAINQMEILEKILFLMKQYDFMIQLLIQNLMIANDKVLKFRCYDMLFILYYSRQRIVDNYCFHQFPIKFNFSRVSNIH